ncbi:DNA internalization-related competence protein ComEC/Rec2 [soil metagenome]
MSGGYLNWVNSLMIFLVVFVLWLIIEYKPGKHFSILKTGISTILYSILIILFGSALWVFHQERKTIDIEDAAPLQLYEWETVTIEGTVRASGVSQSGRDIYEIETEQTTFGENATWNHQFKIRLYGNENIDHEMTGGMQITAGVRLYAFPKVRNPHDFDYGSWLISRNIVAHGELQEVISKKPGNNISWQRVRDYVQNNIELLFSEKEAPLAKALMIGYKEELTRDERLSFSRAGLSHIMAVSGMHVGFIIAPFWLMIPWLWRWKWGKWSGLIIMTMLLFGYAGLTGFSASVSRASIMAWFLTYGKLFHKLRHSINLLAVAAIILLVIQPQQLFDVGFQLSFSAVLIILLILPEARKIIPQKHRHNWRGGLLTIIIISVIVQLGLFPFLTTYFGEFSVAGPLANALVVPLLSLAVPAGLIITLLNDITFGLSELIAMPVGWVLMWIGSVADYFGNEFPGYIEYDQTTFLLFIVWLFAILSVAAVRLPSIRWKLMICLFASLNMLLIERIVKKTSGYDLTVTVLDVGQGDAIHVRTPSDKHFFVDTGRWTPMGNSGEQVLLPYIQHLGINKLDGIILSHPHADHIGGLTALMKSVPIDTIYHSSYPYDSQLYEQYNQLAEKKDIPIRDVAAGDIITLDPLIKIFVVGPEATGTPDRNPNNHSLSIRLQYGETSFLFTGDAEVNQERQLVDRYSDFLDVSFLKAGHHGSRTSSTGYFIETVKPDIAVASLSFRNRFNHPNNEAVTNLANAGAKKYFTSLSGALIFRSDGYTIEKIQK